MPVDCHEIIHCKVSGPINKTETTGNDHRNTHSDEAQKRLDGTVRENTMLVNETELPAMVAD